MNQHDLITLVASVLGSGGFFSALYLLLKLKPESASIVVKSAEDVVLIQSGLIEDLRKSLDIARVQIGEAISLKEEIVTLKHEIARFKEEVKSLRAELASRNGHTIPIQTT